MKKLILFLLPFLVIQSFWAQHNISSISQDFYCEAYVLQTGGNNFALIEQNEEVSIAIIEQIGQSNYSAIYQHAPRNTASTKIVGDNNGVNILPPPNFTFDPLGWTQFQTGVDNHSIVDILGNNNQFAQAQLSVVRSTTNLNIIGDDNISVQYQYSAGEPVYSENIIIGNSNQSYTAQFNTMEPTYSRINVIGDNNLSTVYQDHGFITYSNIVQKGSMNTADVYQYWIDQESDIFQTGNENSASVYQTTIGNRSLISQFGDGNYASVIQESGSSKSNIDQLGNNNFSTVIQTEL